MEVRHPRRILIGTCILAFALGLITAGIGPVIPELARQSGATVVEVGGIFTAFFLGALISQVLSGPISDRFGYRGVIAVGAGAMAVGVVALTLSPSLVLVLGFGFLGGLGQGTVDLCINILVSQVFVKKNVTALNVLNMFFGVGAFAGPALVSLALAAWGAARPVLWLGAAIMVGMAIWTLREVPGRVPVVHEPSSETTDRSIYRSSLLWVFSLLLLLYVGLEQGMGGWTTIYMQKTTTVSVEMAALVTSFFWLALTTGRLISAGIGTRVRSQVVLGTTLFGAGLGGLLLTAGRGSLGVSTAGVIITGLCFGAVYPTAFAMVTAVFRKAPGRATSVVAASGSIGGMLLPTLQGVVLERIHPFASAWYVAAGNLLMLLVFGLILARWAALHRQGAGLEQSPAIE